MRRKLTKNGPSSLCVSLPSKWIKKNQIQKGEDVNLEEVENRIIISSINTNSCKQKEVNFKDIDLEAQKDILLSLHKKGVDEIRILVDEEKTVKDIYSFLEKSNLGYDIVNQTKGSIIVKSVSNPENEEFYNLFKRTFRLSLQFGEKINRVLQEEEEITETTMLHAKSITKLANYCQRIIVKEEMKDSLFYYQILDSLVLISTELNSLYQEVADDEQVSVELVDQYNDIYETFYSILSLHEKFDLKEYAKLKKQILKHDKTIYKHKKAQQKTFCCWEHVDNISRNILIILKSILAINS